MRWLKDDMTASQKTFDLSVNCVSEFLCGCISINFERLQQAYSGLVSLEELKFTPYSQHIASNLHTKNHKSRFSQKTFITHLSFTNYTTG